MFHVMAEHHFVEDFAASLPNEPTPHIRVSHMLQNARGWLVQRTIRPYRSFLG